MHRVVGCLLQGDWKHQPPPQHLGRWLADRRRAAVVEGSHRRWHRRECEVGHWGWSWGRIGCRRPSTRSPHRTDGLPPSPAAALSSGPTGTHYCLMAVLHPQRRLAVLAPRIGRMRCLWEANRDRDRQVFAISVCSVNSPSLFPFWVSASEWNWGQNKGQSCVCFQKADKTKVIIMKVRFRCRRQKSPGQNNNNDDYYQHHQIASANSCAVCIPRTVCTAEWGKIIKKLSLITLRPSSAQCTITTGTSVLRFHFHFA